MTGADFFGYITLVFVYKMNEIWDDLDNPKTLRRSYEKCHCSWARLVTPNARY